MFGVLAMATAAAGLVACRTANRAPTHVEGQLASGAGDGGAATPIAFDDEKATGRLVAFKNDDEVGGFMARWREAEEAKARARATPTAYPMKGPTGDAGAPVGANAAPSPPPAASGAPVTAAPRVDAVSRSKTSASADKAPKDESITNNQHADVDEGDIVKLHGDHLVVLRRGRLFTVSLGGDKVRLSRMHDAFGPDIDPRGTWYDEMVVEGDHVVVVGFSYARGGTEIGLFKIDGDGQLTYRATYHLRSSDYYSARNYASRIVDGRLVFYSPTYLAAQAGEATDRFPAYRRWKKDAKGTDFVRTLGADRLYHLEGEVPNNGYAALHTVTTCDLREPQLRCESTGVIGPQGRVFYVSPTHVYVWMQDWNAAPSGEGRTSGLLAKMPIGRGNTAVTAVRVSGMPTDPFSFEEDDTGHLDVLVRSQANGDAMFASESTAGAAALLRIPLGLFSEGVPTASARRYRAMPRPDGFAVQNRFVGPWLLYGAGNGYVTQHHGGGQLYAVRYAAKDEVQTVNIEQGVDRIEPMGEDAVVVGSRGADLVFTPVELGAGAAANEARARRDYVRKNASQGELRSHGFFYKPTAGVAREGVIGMPIRTEGDGGASYLLEGSASVLFLSHRALGFTELGSLAASPLKTDHDGCRASCVDWYGNARPIFAKNRVFALMGYELVEGRLMPPNKDGQKARIVERGRLSFAPIGGAPANEWD